MFHSNVWEPRGIGQPNSLLSEKRFIRLGGGGGVHMKGARFMCSSQPDLGTGKPCAMQLSD